MRLTARSRFDYTICIDPVTIETRFDPWGTMHAFFSALNAKDTDGVVFEVKGDSICETFLDLAKDSERFPIPIRVRGELLTLKTRNGSRVRAKIEQWELQ